MNDHLAKTISTCAIWLATAIIFTFGFFRYDVNGMAIVFWLIIGCALVIAPTVATLAVWNIPLNRKNPESKSDTEG